MNNAATINKTKTVRILGEVNVQAITELVLGLPDGLWEYETKNRNNDFKCFHSTEHIILKFHKSITDPSQFMTKPLWGIWEDKLMPLIKTAVKPYEYEKGVIPKAMFAKLLAKSKIDSHIDSGERNRYCHKIHIPIQTDPDVLFYVGNQPYELKVGYAYEVNNIVPHHVINNSSKDRIHFIFEYFNQEY